MKLNPFFSCLAYTILLPQKEVGLKFEYLRVSFSVKWSLKNNLFFNIKTDDGQAETLIPSSPQLNSEKNTEAKRGNKVRYQTHG